MVFRLFSKSSIPLSKLSVIHKGRLEGECGCEGKRKRKREREEREREGEREREREREGGWEKKREMNYVPQSASITLTSSEGFV